MPAEIHALDAIADRNRVAALLAEAEDYYRLWLGHPAAEAEIDDFFTGGPAGLDPTTTRHLGLFLDGHLSGVAELIFGFPGPGDPYLSLMILAPRARSQGHGQTLLAHVEAIASASGARTLYLAVLAANTRGRAFWDRMGFVPTGLSGTDNSHGLHHTIYRLAKPL